MEILHSAAELKKEGRRFCSAIGVFDGVHLGHQQVIRQAVTDAQQCEGKSLVVTFDRHPNAVVAPERVPPLIYSLPQKMRAIAALGVDLAWLITFDQEFSQRSGEKFIRDLVRD
ncbi:MAG TPA: hypothetical protein VGE41_02480, partial [Verrucomicrobiae bacterium]